MKQNAPALGILNIDEKGPLYKEAKELMAPLRYSSLKDFLDPETRLSVNFADKEWTLHNIHHFDKDGKLQLKDGRYGMCGDLAAYMYEHLSPSLDAQYSITFIRVAESSFFPLPQGSHYVLKITDNSVNILPREFILDPSFHKYKRIEYFDDYMFLEEKPTLKFYENKDKDQTFAINFQYPLFIKNNYILQMAVRSVSETFDKNNFAVDLTMTKRYQYIARPVFSIRSKNGVRGVYRNEDLAMKILSRKKMERFFERISYFFDNL